jgi:hypothetical protein
MKLEGKCKPQHNILIVDKVEWAAEKWYRKEKHYLYISNDFLYLIILTNAAKYSSLPETTLYDNYARRLECLQNCNKTGDVRIT